MRVQRHEQLIVWQRAIELVCAAYEVSSKLPRSERHALADQMRRAVISIPANIAEGHSRAHRKEFLQFLSIAAASLAELETHLVIAERVGHLTPAATSHAAALAAEVGRMLTAMRKRLSDSSTVSARRYTLDAGPVTQHTARKNSSQSRIP